MHKEPESDTAAEDDGRPQHVRVEDDSDATSDVPSPTPREAGERRPPPE